MLIEKAIRNFVTARKIENCTPRTLNWYENTLRYFLRWLSATYGVVEVGELELNHLREWISYLQDTPSRKGGSRSDSYITSCARALMAFCRWLESEEVVDRPFSTKFKLPREEQKFIPTFTSDDVEKLFAACDVVDKRWPKLSRALASRNRAILSVLLDTGMRLKELVGLRLCDVDKDKRLLLVHRKGNWWQQVPISWDGFKHLHEYLTRYRPYLASRITGDDASKVRPLAHKNDPVFLTRAGKPLAAQGVESVFVVLKERAGIQDKHVSPHNCRRYMATTQLAMGRSPLDVQRQMGHKTLTMTNRYASLTVEHLQQSHDLHSPLRTRNVKDDRDALGTGYWDVE